VYFPAILFRVYRISSSPNCRLCTSNEFAGRRPCANWLFCFRTYFSNEPNRLSGHFVSLLFSIPCGALLAVMLQRNAMYPLFFVVFADYFLCNRGYTPLPPPSSRPHPFSRQLVEDSSLPRIANSDPAGEIRPSQTSPLSFFTGLASPITDHAPFKATQLTRPASLPTMTPARGCAMPRRGAGVP
jgi:hypothetical protein